MIDKSSQFPSSTNVKCDSSTLVPSLAAQGASGTQAGSSVLGADGTPLGLMSCDELLVWLEQKLTGMAGRLRDKMGFGDKNADAQNKLKDVALAVNNCRSGAGDSETAAKAIRAALDAHGADGTISPELKDKFNKMLEKLDAATALQKMDPAQRNQLMFDQGLDVGAVEKIAKGTPDISDAQYDDIAGSITNQSSALDQLSSKNLTEINLLAAQMSQATGLVSGMMSSFNDSAKGIISNMRG